MSQYCNRNVRGKWEKIEVTDAEVAEVTKRNFIYNMNTAIECVVNVRSAMEKSARLKGVAPVSHELVDSITLAITEKMLKPLHYDIENYVDEKLDKGNVL